ncbi:MAG: 2,3,4,5-tetrahydropyridine-2,6-dicarboxylate N-succinyltransferase [Pseudomonadota bacterium]|jgi:acetyltransferase-like isoleucine patch superfamily enzyme
MTSFRLNGGEYSVPQTGEELSSLEARLCAEHPVVRGKILLVACSSDRGGRTEWGAVMGEQSPLFAHLAYECLGEPRLDEGFAEVRISHEQVGSLLAPFGGTAAPRAIAGLLRTLGEAYTDRRAVTVTVLMKETGRPAEEGEYLRRRTTILFDLFNSGALRGTDTPARQALLDSFTTLPNRFLSEGGQFIVPLQEDPVFFRRVKSYTEWSGPIAEISPGGIDKFPSLLSIRANELLLDGNRIVPSAMIRDGVHIGKRNIFMFHAAVNIAAYIGDDNLIDSHASIASSAQIGSKNKIGSFVSIEGVLSPANAEPVVIGDENFLGTFVRIGTGIRVGDNNFIGAGVNLSLGTKLRDCRADSLTRGEYIAVRDINAAFSRLSVTPNNAARDFEGVALLPGEYVLFENTPDFMARFDGDSRIKAPGR